MATKQTVWGTTTVNSISTAVTMFIDFKGCSDLEIECAVSGEEFSGSEVLGANQAAASELSAEQIARELAADAAKCTVFAVEGGENDWSDLAA